MKTTTLAQHGLNKNQIVVISKNSESNFAGKTAVVDSVNSQDNDFINVHIINPNGTRQTTTSKLAATLLERF